MKNILSWMCALISLVFISGCGTAALDKRKQSLIDENNLSSTNTVTTFCSYYTLPKNSKITKLETMYFAACGIDILTGNFYIKAFTEEVKLDKKINFSELANFGQTKYALGGAVCDAIVFLCMPKEQLILETKTLKYIIEFHKRDTDAFAKVYRNLKLQEVVPSNIYTIHIPVVVIN